MLLKSRRLIHLSGPDSTNYLQGAITANLKGITPTSTGFYAAFLNAQGRVLNDVFIYPMSPNSGTHGQDYLIEVDADEAESLIRHIKKYKLRAKFQVRIVDEGERGVWFLWLDPTPPEPGQNHDGSLHPPAYPTHPDRLICTDARAPGFGYRYVLPPNLTPMNVLHEREQSYDLAEFDETDYKIRRYLHGIPEGPKEIIREAALVQESNIDYMGGVDYRKGCYVGQELTIRTHHTGVVRKRILPLMLYPEGEGIPQALEYKRLTGQGEAQGDAKGEEPGVIDGAKIEPGTQIGRVGKKGRTVGKWLGGVGNIGLGLVRLEVMTDIVVQGEASGYKAGDKFRIGEEEDGVRVKAFVPDWHLNR